MPSIPPLSADERQHLERLRELAVLDSGPEPLFDAIVRQACALCGTAVGLIGLLDEQRLWFKATVGLPGLRELPREQAFGAEALAAGSLFEVADARLDGRLATHPLVTGSAQLRFFAGVPLRLGHGEPVGSLCVMGREPRRLTPDQAQALHSLADIASHAFEAHQAMGRQAVDLAQQVADEDLALRQLADGLRELTTIIDNTTDLVVQTDARGQVLYMNPSARKAFGLQPDEALGERDFGEFITPSTRHLFAETIVPAVHGGTVWVGETQVTLEGRGTVPMSHMVIGHRDAQGHIEHYSSVMRDISAAVQAKQESLRQTDILRSVTEAIPATVVVVGPDGRYRFVNGAFERYCGHPRERILGRSAIDVLGEAEVERRRPWMKRAFTGETVHFTLEYPGLEGSTHLALSCIPLHTASGEIDGFVGVTQDITQQKREEDRLVQLAQRDPLTGLLNRSGFESGLELLLLHQAEHAGLAVLYIDLDNFKPVNDRHGHPAGDQVLALFARRLAALVRPSDMVARFGGDEFAIALGGMREATHAEAVADKVLAAACTPFDIGTQQLTIGASVGVAFSSDARPVWRELLGKADVQLLAAKAAGKGRQLSSVS